MRADVRRKTLERASRHDRPRTSVLSCSTGGCSGSQGKSQTDSAPRGWEPL